MQLQESRQGEVLIVAVEGRLDTASAAEFESRILAMIDAGAHRICIDCGGLTYLNSTALRGFLLIAKRMGTVGGRAVVSNLCPNTRKVFEVIGFTKIITLVSTREEALQLLSTQGAAI